MRALISAGLSVMAVLLATSSLLSCDVNDYCINCGNGDILDGGRGDGPRDAPGSDGNLGPDAGPCAPTGNEVCDNKDNDCNGMIDDGALPQVGDDCGSTVGECTVGIKACVAGVLTCGGVNPVPEICDGKDNDCNGTIDNGDPGGGGACGTDAGECAAGTNRCVSGVVTCIGAIGGVGQVPESCDGKDNDCDGNFDEGLTNLGSCGTSDVGACAFGVLTCSGGLPICTGDVSPAFELCDAIDQDCDGNPTNGFDLARDARNCGACGNVCTAANATSSCVSSACAVGACAGDYYDNDRNPANGCEYGPCTFQGPIEACNGRDDNCNGGVDDNLTPPNICRTVGACAGTVATCGGATGWDCGYGATVSVDGNGDIIPETECDGIDNDCDGKVDEGDPDKGDACNDGLSGICRATGTKVCDLADRNAPTVCQITRPGQAPGVEACDNLDNDCDNKVDEGANTGNLPGQEWVNLGGVQIMKYEASRPDATATDTGAAAGGACSRAGAQPWVNIKAPQAAAVCASVGARLCTEQEWHRSCSVVATPTFPIAAPTGTAIADRVLIEAENFSSSTTATFGGTLRAWVPDSAAGFSGISAMRASPNDGGFPTNAEALTGSPRLDYQVNFANTGNHVIWLRMLAPSANDRSVYVGINDALPGAAGTIVNVATGTWRWVKGPTINVASAGVKFVNIWMGTDGVRVDSIIISRETSTTAPPNTPAANGNKWAYASNANTASIDTCNADPLDTDAVAPGDQDDNLPTGQNTSCFANGAGTNDAFDMSGNVREWTAPRQPGANPIRGGAGNTTVEGTSCDLAFTLADDNFFFPNVGFRCCRAAP
jgi:hypothetical protein